MNKIFKVIWNHSAQRFDVCSELTKSHGKSTSSTDERSSVGSTLKTIAISAIAAGAMLGSAETMAAVAIAETNTATGAPTAAASIVSTTDAINIGNGVVGSDIPVEAGIKSGSRTVGIGDDISAPGSRSVVIGYGATSTATYTGGNAPSAFDTVVIGNNATADRRGQVVIGSGASAQTGTSSPVGAVVIGQNATVTGQTESFVRDADGNIVRKEASVGSAHKLYKNPYNPLSVKNGVGGNKESVDEGLSDEQKAEIEKIANYIGTDPTLDYLHETPATGGYAGATAVSIGSEATAEQSGISIGTKSFTGRNPETTLGMSIALGHSAVGLGGGIAVGGGTAATGSNSIAMGRQAAATGATSMALGAASAAVGGQSIALGHSSTALGNHSVAIGASNSLQEYDHGNATISRGEDSVAFGYRATTYQNATRSIAIGQNASAHFAENVILGSESSDTSTTNHIETGGQGQDINDATVNGVTYGGFAGSSLSADNQSRATVRGVVSVGAVRDADDRYDAANYTRQIVNVAPGEISIRSTDAINGSQLYLLAETIVDMMPEVVPADDAPEGTVTSETDPKTGKTTYKINNTQATVVSSDGTVKVTPKPAANANGTTEYDLSVSIPEIVTTALTNNDEEANEAGKVQEPADGSALVNATTVMDAINNSGFTLKHSVVNGGEDLKGDAELINPGDTVEMIAGKNLSVKQEADGKITYATKENVSFTNITVAAPDSTDTPITIAENKITGLDPVIEDQGKNGTKPTDLDPTQAVAMEDLLNAGWNLQIQEGPTGDVQDVDYVTPYNTVDFIADTGLTIKQESDGDKSKITIGLAAGGTVDLESGEGGNEPDGRLSIGSNPTGFVTAQNVVDMVNNVSWFTNATDTAAGSVVSNTDDKATAIKAGSHVNFDAGHNMEVAKKVETLNETTGALEVTYTYQTSMNPTFENVTTGGDVTVNEDGSVTVTNPIVMGKNEDGNNAVSGLDGHLPAATDKDGNPLTVKFDAAGNPTYFAADGSEVPAANVADTITNAPSVEKPEFTNAQLGEAATLGDVLNAGWNLQENGNAVDYVTPYNTVNFVEGDGITITSDTDGEKSDIIVAVKKSPIKMNGEGLPTDETVTTVTNEAGEEVPVTKNEDGTYTDAAGNVYPADTAVTETPVEYSYTAGDTINYVDGSNTKANIKPSADGTGYDVTFDVVTGDSEVTPAGIATPYTDKDGNPLTKNADGTFTNANGDIVDEGDVVDSSTTVATVGDIVDTINRVGWFTNSTTASVNDDGADTLINAGDQVDFEKGVNIELTKNYSKDADGKETVTYTYATVMNPVFDNVTTGGDVTYTDKDGNKITKKPDGTYVDEAGNVIAPSNVVATANKPIFMGKDEAGNNVVSGLDGHLPAATDKDGNPLTVKYDANGNPTYFAADGTEVPADDVADTITNATNVANPYKDSPAPVTEAATLGDVLNAGWNLGIANGTNPTDSVDYVTPYNTVNFIGNNGINITATSDGDVSNITVGLDLATVDKKAETNAETSDVVNPNTGATTVEPDKADNLITAGAVSNAINNSGWNTNSTTATGEATNTLVNPGDAVNFEAGPNLQVSQVVETVDGVDTISYIYSTVMNPTFNNVTTGGDVTYADKDGNPLTLNEDGTYTNAAGDVINPADVVTNVETPIVMGKNEAGNNAVSGLDGHLPAATDKDGNPLTVKFDAAGNPTYYTANGDVYEGDVTDITNTKDVKLPEYTNAQKGEAATLGDVLNAGWNLQANGEGVDYVTPYNTVNFEGTNGIVVSADSDGDKSTITIGIETATVNPESTDLTSNTGAVEVADADKNKFVTAQTLVNAINNSGWKATSGAKDGGAVVGTTEELINPSETVTYQAGKNMKVEQEGNVFTYSTQNDVDFHSVSLSNPIYTDAAGNPVTQLADGSFVDAAGNPIAAGDVTTTAQPTVNLVNEAGKPVNNAGTGQENTTTPPALNITGVDADGNVSPTQITGVASSLNTKPVDIAPNGEGSEKPAGDDLLDLTDIADVVNNAVTVGDIANMGWIVTAEEGNGYKDTVKNANQVDFRAGSDSVSVTGNTTADGVRRITVDVNTGNIANNANGTVKYDELAAATAELAAAIAAGDQNAVEAARAKVNSVGSKLATAKQVQDAINGSGWQTKANLVDANGNPVESALVNPGDTVNYVTAAPTTDANGNVTSVGAVAKTVVTQGADGKDELNVQYSVETTQLPVLEDDSATSGAVIAPSKANANKLVTAGDLANTINNVHWKLDADKVENSTGVVKNDTKPAAVKAGNTVTVKAGNNIEITRSGRDIAIATSMTPTFNSVQLGGANGPVITNSGDQIKVAKADGSPTRVTNVAPARIAADSTDAVNGSQLHAVKNDIRKLNKKRKAGHASAAASSSLLQAYREGQSVVTAGVGQYQGQTGVAVGYSRIADSGKVGIKLHVGANTQKELSAGAAIGYFW